MIALTENKIGCVDELNQKLLLVALCCLCIVVHGHYFVGVAESKLP